MVERCGHKLPRVHSLITLGGQHQGVANTPGCTTEHMSVCSAMQVRTVGAPHACAGCCEPVSAPLELPLTRMPLPPAVCWAQLLLARGAYAPWVRENIVQAQYFKVGAAHAASSQLRKTCCCSLRVAPCIRAPRQACTAKSRARPHSCCPRTCACIPRPPLLHLPPAPQDPYALEQYLSSNIFLPDINNEQPDKNSRYADNLAALQRFVMIRFDADTTGEAAS